MKILDKYLIKSFLLTIVFALIAFTLVFVIIDIMENLDDFIDQNVAGYIIAYYYVVFTPEILKVMIPVSVLFSALFTVGKASNLSELTAIKASGIGIYRFMSPFIFSTIFICLITIVFSGYIVPIANKTKINIEREYLAKGLTNASSNIFFQDSETRLVSISFYDERSQISHKVSIQNFDANDPTKIISRIDTPTMAYDSVHNYWKALNGSIRTFNDSLENVSFFNAKILSGLNFKPNELIEKQQKPEEMNLSELKALIKTQEKVGTDPTRTQIEYYSRFSFSMASLIVVFFGLTISANKRGGSLGSQIGLNILATFIYLVFMKVSNAFGKNGALNPMLTAWFANFIFLLAALVNIPRLKQ
ncbi:MAG: LPS export ABC transporter permease LptG [Ignavibacteriales bacterium CG12_big_fil_rev_8_21_14_0_65_30_8]|nr:MAG: LPS export ABC transporter permease LptG [Ignavibacteriales bacterium CG12_big_fil_rev_8_21_14_0_65_30_8]